MNVYEFDDYKEALRAEMSERRRQFGSRFTFEKMAKACGVQKTYLSKVLNGPGHLNPDQLFSCGEYLKLRIQEIEHLLALREREIAQNSTRATLLTAKINEIRREKLKTDSAIETVPEAAIENRKWEYFTDVDLQLVHLFLTVPYYAENPNEICERIGIGQSRLDSILLKLQDWQLIDYSSGIYKAKDPQLHLSQDSPAFLAFGILNRLKTIEKIRDVKFDKSEDSFFSASFSAKTSFQRKLRKKIQELLKETQGEVIKSKSEQVYQLNIDFFRWS